MNAITIIGEVVEVNENATLEEQRREIAAILEDCMIGLHSSAVLEQAQKIHTQLWQE